MKPGTPGFVGARLTEAREARGITASALAELLGVSRQAIYQYEGDKQTPHPDIFEQICNKLNLPGQFFLRPPRSMDPSTIFFRCLSSTTASERTKAERKVYWLFEILSFALKHVELPSVNLPRLDVPSDPSALSDEKIEELAELTREHWKRGLGPISNIVLLLENNGVCVARMVLESQRLNGFSKWIGNHPMVVLGADKDCSARSRFDAAHELGHLLLHRNVDTKRFTNAAQHKMIEQQAHRFAGAFLMPQRSFAGDITLPTLDNFRILKEKWRCSIGMMVMRAEQLGFISEEQKTALFINYSRRGWRRREPLDDVLPVEEPRLMRKVFDLIINSNVKSKDDVASTLPFAMSDIEDLAGLTRKYFSSEQAMVIQLRQPASVAPDSTQSQSGQPGEVIPFPRNRRI